MSLLPMLSGEVQESIDELGAPMPVVGRNGRILMLVETFFTQAPDGYSARIPGIQAFGEGQTKEEAAIALQEALRGYLRAFDDEANGGQS